MELLNMVATVMPSEIMKVYVRLTVQLDAHVFICILYSSIFVLHVSGAICTHHQEHKLQSTAIDMRNGYGMLIHWSRYWLGHTHTSSTDLTVLEV
jgi:hypothetical protein